ncbi:MULTISPECIES: alpha/beta fold hydrolase [Catenuloplanes]|uniref:Pimeloyl-ACP methyl ester carboxylesterase n=1 Tax=Catenuloplanes niger TaxID=587534 RepID=A0AAE3ZIM2_9ACTN|nr:alpha/beta hydrolase [Catenuloplanes niger]MDR7319876.1 pimeloyl-ACP methyl ester carboxylesterase [Catenuloplanes niger]
MTVVFLHGVPETPAIWDGVRQHIPGDSIALRLPGFGSARPEHLTGKDAYADWLAGELRAIGGPIDLVGHDWGGHLAMRVVTAFDDVPVRSWVSDVAHGWHPDYRWHDAATLWQGSPAGEESLTGLRTATPGSGGTFGDILQGRGMTPDIAKEVDAVHDETMSAAILTLYRSAWPNFHADWGQAITGPLTTPGLLLAPTGDMLSGVEQDEDMARRLGAKLVKVEGLSHYWMLQQPAKGAEILRDFWASIPGATRS